MRRIRGVGADRAKNSRQLVSREIRSLKGHAASEANLDRVDGGFTAFADNS